MTPEEARQLLEGITPAPWEFESVTSQKVGCPEVTEFWATGRYDVQIAEQDATEEHRESTEKDFILIAAAPGMAAMIANMTAEYAVQVRRSDGWQYSRDEDDFRWQPLTVQIVRADRDHPHEETRIVMRYVTAAQPLEGEHP